jgi:hypothetical protein
MPESGSADVTRSGNKCDAHELISVPFASRIVPANLDTNACGRGGAFVLHDVCG